jgi:hypothetical protein
VIAFVLYGHQYAFSLQLSFFFALAAAVYVVFLSYTGLAASVGAGGAKMSAVRNVLPDSHHIPVLRDGLAARKL